MILAGNVALESMGFKTFGFAGGREDVYEPEDDVYWGPETEWLDDKRYSGERDLENPLAAVQMGLIYVNPEGPNGKPDPVAAARDIRETFRRMAMNDEETVALIAGPHLRQDPRRQPGERRPRGRPPAGADGLGWKAPSAAAGPRRDPAASRHLDDTHQVGQPVPGDLFGYSGSCKYGYVASGRRRMMCARSSGRTHHLCVAALRGLRADARRPGEPHGSPHSAWLNITATWAKSRYLGPEVPSETLVWRDPIPERTALIGAGDIAALKPRSRPGLWCPAGVHRVVVGRVVPQVRHTRGANGARIRLEPMNNWEVNQPEELRRVLSVLEDVQRSFNESQTGGKQVSLADLIVLGGCAAVEKAARDAGHDIEVPFTPGRTDASQEQTDVASFAEMEPTSDGFRNYVGKGPRSGGYSLIDQANLLTLTAPEMTVLIGGMRVLGANHGQSAGLGVFTDRPGTLTNDFFVNLLDMDTTWAPTTEEAEVFEGRDASGEVRWTGSRVDLVFGSNSELRALAEVYAGDDAQEKFVRDFVAAWDKVMNLDRFDLRCSPRTPPSPAEPPGGGRTRSDGVETTTGPAPHAGPARSFSARFSAVLSRPCRCGSGGTGPRRSRRPRRPGSRPRPPAPGTAGARRRSRRPRRPRSSGTPGGGGCRRRAPRTGRGCRRARCGARAPRR